jgi:hypothetical protein
MIVQHVLVPIDFSATADQALAVCRRDAPTVICMDKEQRMAHHCPNQCAIAWSIRGLCASSHDFFRTLRGQSRC